MICYRAEHGKGCGVRLDLEEQRQRYLQLACLLPWQDSPVSSQGIAAVVEDWDNGMRWGKEVWRERSV